MNAGAPRTALREIGAIIRQTADLRRLCLSLREAMNREKEATLLVEFERLFLDAGEWISTDVRVLRTGFREMWRGGEYARIVAVAHRLPSELVEGDETLLMYFACASRRLAAGSAAGGVSR